MPIWGMVLSALAEIRVGKVRVILSAFCVACLVATVTLVTALAGITQQSAQKVFEQETGRPGTLEMYVDFGGSERGPNPPSKAALENIRQTMARYHVTYSALTRVGEAQIRKKDGSILRTRPRNGPPEFEMIGSDHGLRDIRSLKVLAGRWLSPTDDQRLQPALVVSDDFTKRLRLTPAQALGTEVELAAEEHWVKARIVGVIDTPGMNFGGDPVGQVYLPYTSMVRWGFQVEQTMFALRVPPDDVKRVVKQLNRDKTSWGVPNVHLQKRYGNYGVIGGKLKLMMLGAAVALLMLGSLPVVVLGIFAVRQRRSEFGVHRCFGATGSDLFLTVLLEGLIVCTSAGAVGVGAAYLVQSKATDLVLERIGDGADLDTSFPWEAAQLGLGVAVCVGVFTGLIPAMRAMQRSVIRAIRA